MIMARISDGRTKRLNTPCDGRNKRLNTSSENYNTAHRIGNECFNMAHRIGKECFNMARRIGKECFSMARRIGKECFSMAHRIESKNKRIGLHCRSRIIYPTHPDSACGLSSLSTPIPYLNRINDNQQQISSVVKCQILNGRTKTGRQVDGLCRRATQRPAVSIPACSSVLYLAN